MKRKIIIALVILGILAGLWTFLSSRATDPKLFAQTMLDKADIRINGDRPWDIKVHNEKFYDRVMQQGSLGLGESYMDGWWDCPALDQCFTKIFEADLPGQVHLTLPLLISMIKAKFMNLQSKSRAFQVGQEHYDLDNDLFQKMLDSRMIYSCGYWKDANSIDEAQRQKLELLCQKLNLKPGMKLLDIGCGWGGLALYAAQNYGVDVAGITISKEQAHFAQECCKGLPVRIVLKDYRDLDEKFDRIVSVGMFEHVGSKNYDEFMKVAHRCLKDDGIFLLHTIGGNVSTIACDPWITKYIFPNGQLPSVTQISKAAEGLFIMEDWHNFGADYDKTLMAWHSRFNESWDSLKTNYDDRFYRMWNYYLLSCAGLFRSRNAQLWQIVFSKRGVPGGYTSLRTVA